MTKSLHCWGVFFGNDKILRYVFSGWFGKICFCNERTPKDVLPRGAQLKMRLSRISWLIQVSERRRAKKPGYDFSLHREIVCTFWKYIFFFDILPGMETVINVWLFRYLFHIKGPMVSLWRCAIFCQGNAFEWNNEGNIPACSCKLSFFCKRLSSKYKYGIQ